MKLALLLRNVILVVNLEDTSIMSIEQTCMQALKNWFIFIIVEENVLSVFLQQS